MIDNIRLIESDFLEHTVFQGAERAGLFLLDFAAAFPSIAHEYLFAALRSAGLPPWLLQFVRALYVANDATLVVAGSKHAGFSLKAGIRQGCPLSPILFAIAMDVLLRRLHRLAPDAVIRAFADDVGAVAANLFRDAQTFGTQFMMFGRISGLLLNMPKTVIVPLAVVDWNATLAALAHQQAGWGGVQLRFWARYLGFAVGPGREHHAYEKAMDKFMSRAADWGACGGGLLASAAAYGVYVTSTLSFLIQLD